MFENVYVSIGSGYFIMDENFWIYVDPATKDTYLFEVGTIFPMLVAGPVQGWVPSSILIQYLFGRWESKDSRLWFRFLCSLEEGKQRLPGVPCGEPKTTQEINLPSFQGFETTTVALSSSIRLKKRKNIGEGGEGIVWGMEIEKDGKRILEDLVVKIMPFSMDTMMEAFMTYMLSLLTTTKTSLVFPAFLGNMVLKDESQPDDPGFQTIFTELYLGPLPDILPTMTASDFLHVFLQVIHGVGVAENLFQFGHGDLHLENIMLSQESSSFDVMIFDDITLFNVPHHPVVIDFGLSTLRIPTEWIARKLESPDKFKDRWLPWDTPLSPDVEALWTPFLSSLDIPREKQDNCLIMNHPFVFSGAPFSFFLHEFYQIVQSDSKDLSRFLPFEEVFEKVDRIWKDQEAGYFDPLDLEEDYLMLFPGYPTTLEEEILFMQTFPEHPDDPKFYLPFHKEVFLCNAKKSSLLFLSESLQKCPESLASTLFGDYLMTVTQGVFELCTKVRGTKAETRFFFFFSGLFPYLSFYNLSQTRTFVTETKKLLSQFSGYNF